MSLHPHGGPCLLPPALCLTSAVWQVKPLSQNSGGPSGGWSHSPQAPHLVHTGWPPTPQEKDPHPS